MDNIIIKKLLIIHLIIKNRDDALNEMNIIKQILSKGDTITYSFS